MEPFDVSCPECQRKLRVKQPELVGRKVYCPQCKARFRIEAPLETAAPSASAAPAPAAASPNAAPQKSSSAKPRPKLASSRAEASAGPSNFAPPPNETNAPASDDPMSFLSAATSGGEVRGKSSSSAARSAAKGKKASKKTLWITAASAGGLVALVVTVTSVQSCINQQNIASLTGADKARYDALRAEHGDNINVVVLPSAEAPAKPSLPPIPKELPPFLEADAQISRVQDMLRVHKRHAEVEALRAAWMQARNAYIRGSSPPPTYQARITELTAQGDELQARLAKAELLRLFTSEGLKDDVVQSLTDRVDQAASSPRPAGWRDDPEARKKMEASLRDALATQQLDMHADLFDRVFELVTRCY